MKKMKKIILALIMTLPMIGLCQENSLNKTIIESSAISETEKTIVGLIESASTTAMSGVMTGVDFILKEGTEVVSQYIIFTSIKFLSLIILGLFLIFLSVKIIPRYFRLDKVKSENYNLTIDKQMESNNEDLFSVNLPKKRLLFLDNYYKNIIMIIIEKVLQLSFIFYGVNYLLNNILPFIKITFFPKLYLFDLAIQFINIK